MIKFKTGDSVKITSGKDKGREGKIEKINLAGGLALIPGINIYKKHVKGTGSEKGQKGGIYELSRPLPFAKIVLVCPKCKKITRVAFKTVGKEKVRVCKKCAKEIDIK
ncbi:MAG: 50S ribosomal protein L24 [Candidatus Microgenomates bacterium]|jgi:large subunit ribosomal protein L24